MTHHRYAIFMPVFKATSNRSFIFGLNRNLLMSLIPIKIISFYQWIFEKIKVLSNIKRDRLKFGVVLQK